MKSKEEILARKLDDLLADNRLEHYLIGRYFAQTATTQNYDNFEVMVESARQEKENRVEWLKDIIIGEKQVTTTFDNKCKILTELWTDHYADEELEDFVDFYDIALPLAFAVTKGHIAGLTKSGEELIDEAFSDLLRQYGESDKGFSSIEEII